MKPYCETVAQIVLPNLRALLAKELMEKYKFTQQDVASKLGLTQSAVSQYLRNLRGSQTKILERDVKIYKEIEVFAGKIASGEINSSNSVEAFCDICKSIRKSKIICELHMKAYPELKDCKVCLC
ncbi:MAG: helix-turn-helix domain-containing protein [Candidatus Aenigmatarchaeota archaeon]